MHCRLSIERQPSHADAGRIKWEDLIFSEKEEHLDSDQESPDSII